MFLAGPLLKQQLSVKHGSAFLAPETRLRLEDSHEILFYRMSVDRRDHSLARRLRAS